MSNTLDRCLATICALKPGERSYQKIATNVHAILVQRLAEAHLVREVRHRDHSRSYVATTNGKAMNAANVQGGRR